MTESVEIVPQTVVELSCQDEEKKQTLARAYELLWIVSKQGLKSEPGLEAHEQLNKLIEEFPWLAPEDSIDQTPLQLLRLEIDLKC